MRESQLSNGEIWRSVFLAIATAAVSAIVILRIWDEWFALVLLGYGLIFMGGYMWLPWRRRIGYAISLGLLVGILIPLLARMVRA
jgi:hypothetical protein